MGAPRAFTAGPKNIIFMKYDDLTIQKLRELAIFDVCSKLGISLYGMGQLTKRAKCWYHDDQHPSMHVNKKKNIYKCFVCGKGGDTIRLVMDHENLSFVEACDWLVHEFSVVVTQIPQKSQKKESVSSVKSVVENNNSVVDKNLSVDSVLSVCPLPSELVSKSLSVNSEFCKSVVSAGYLSESQMRHAAERYRLGASKEGGVIFWEIDQQHQVRTGKIMYYLPDCHRDKQHPPTWVHSLLQGNLPTGFTLQHCLFGLHLLGHTDSTDTTDINSFNSCNSWSKEESVSSVKSVVKNKTSVVCIVESEKTAVICSVLFPDALWLSCGGLQMFKSQLLEPLVHHKVILFPDTDEKGEAYKAWLSVAQQAAKLYPFQYPIRVSPLLEIHATASQKQRKIDLVDFLFEGHADLTDPTDFNIVTQKSAFKHLEFSVNSHRFKPKYNEQSV